MNIPYVSPERRAREHAEILAQIAKDRAEQERKAKEDAIFDEMIFDYPDFQPKPRPEEALTAADFSDKSISPFCGGNSSNYQINIAHPAIAPLFEKYVADEHLVRPISDHHRILFEMHIIHQLDRLHIFKEDYAKPISHQEILNMKYQAIRDRERSW